MTIFSWIGRLFFEDARHNHELYKTGKANRNEVRHTTVGWRRDPIHREDGFTPDPGNNRVIGIDPVTGYEIYDTPSGNREYSRSRKRKWRD